MGYNPLSEGTFSPVLYGRGGSFLLLGGVKKDDGWISGAQAAQYIFNEMDYDFLIPKGSIQIQGVLSNLILLAEITL